MVRLLVAIHVQGLDCLTTLSVGSLFYNASGRQTSLFLLLAFLSRQAAPAQDMLRTDNPIWLARKSGEPRNALAQWAVAVNASSRATGQRRYFSKPMAKMMKVKACDNWDDW